MRSKHILYIFLSIGLTVGCSQSGKKWSGSQNEDKGTGSGKKTILAGKIDHSKATELILLSEQFTDTITLSPLNEFEYKFKLPMSSYFALQSDNRSVRLFLNPGDNLFLEFDQNDIFNTIQFKGKGAEANIFLKEKYQQLLQHTLYTSYMNEVPEKQFRYLADSIYIIEKIFLEDYIKLHPGLTSFFIEQEQASLLYDWANKLMEYPRLSTKKDQINLITYFSFLKKLDVNNPSLLTIYEYKQFLSTYIAWYTGEQLKSLPNKNQGPSKVSLIKMQQTNNLITNEAVKNYMLYSILKEQVKYYGFKNTDPLFEVFELNCTDSGLKKELITPYQQYKKLVSNDKAPLVSFIDITGQSFTLDYFKGSYVYIDIWATWCLPCRRESSHFEELSQKFSNKNIQFVSLSVDKDGNSWKQYLSTFGYSHLQFQVTNPEEFLKNYLIKVLPRFIILDPEGKIINSDAFRPSEPEITWFANLPNKRAI